MKVPGVSVGASCTTASLEGVTLGSDMKGLLKGGRWPCPIQWSRVRVGECRASTAGVVVQACCLKW